MKLTQPWWHHGLVDPARQQLAVQQAALGVLGGNLRGEKTPQTKEKDP